MDYLKLNTDKSKLRIYLSTSENEHRKFYWFQMKDEDCYWGNSANRKHSFCSLVDIKQQGFSIQTPKSFKKSQDKTSKYSLHESGQFHIKQVVDGKFTKAKSIENWGENVETTLLFSVLAQPFTHYPVEGKKLTRDNSFGRAIVLDGEAANRRLFSEFYLTKVNANSREVSLPKFPMSIANEAIHHNFFPLNSEYYILMRYVMFEKLENWHPDKELIFLTNNSNFD
ncbi:MAG: hypothetical protein ACJA1C_001036 [Crocinitomicaceae bacterium]|jgi:hypothetical protein